MERTGRGAIAGTVAVAAALAAGELLAAVLPDAPSPVTAVSSLVVPITPPAVEDWAIATFGTADKAALAVGTVVLALLIGAWVGRVAVRRPAVGTVVFAGFGLFGLVASLLQPTVAALPTVLTAVGTAVVGIGVLHWLLARARPPDPTRHPDGQVVTTTDAGRRRFLAAAGGVLAAAAVAAAVARLAGARTAPVEREQLALPEPVRRLPDVRPAQAFEGIDGLTPIHVPNQEFFRIDTALSVPRIDPDTWQLRIHGLVEQELVLSYAQILELPLSERDVTLACVSNEVGDDLVGTARWLATPLAPLLERAGVRPDAGQVVGRSVDGWTSGFPVDAVTSRGAFLAVGMNGAPLPFEHGFPVRIVVPGLYGYVSATKWLTEIELATWEGFDAYWVPRGWAKQAPIKTQSRIDVPRPDRAIEPGEQVVAGVAWAGTRGISRVELQVDEGPWEECAVTEPLSEAAWVQWRRTVVLAEGAHTLRVRATDGAGTIQTQERTPPRPDGATGWHTVRVST